ncbi:MAG: TonB-dependent receptor [Porphyromonadaceae bacterium]|nr:TonB-dependent receptor [Porphyromonadaceae bacterium]
MLIALFLCLSAQAQRRVEISGKVIDSEGEPMDLVTVSVPSASTGTFTNDKGEYKLHIPAADTVEVIFSYLGYRKETRKLVDPAEKVTLSVRMYNKDRTLSEVEIQEYRRQMSMLQKIDTKDWKLMPDASGGSIEALMATMPGVNSNNELSSQYSVRGGNFDENIVYVNGIEVYRPQLIRSGQQEGLSFINPDMVGSVAFSSGGYPAEYGDKMSSVLDITYRQPESFEGSVSGSFLGVSASVGQKTKRFTQLHGFRFKTNSTLLSTLDTEGEYKPRFFDYQTYLTYKVNSRWDLAFLGNISSNNYQFTPQSRTTRYGGFSSAAQFTVYFDGKEADLFQTYFGALTTTYRPTAFTSLTLLASAYATREKITYDISGEYWLDELDLAAGVDTQESAGTLGYGSYQEYARNSLGADVYAFALKGETRLGRHTLRYGANYQRERIHDRMREWEARDSSGYTLPHTGEGISLISSIHSTQDIESNRFSAYVQETYSLEHTSGIYNFTGGVRLSYWDYNRECIVSPRVSVGFNPAFNSRLTFRFATGLYYQAPFYKEFRDTVQNSQGNWEVVLNNNIKSQRSIHFILGSDYTFRVLDRPFKFTGELYYKKLDHLISYEVDNMRIWYSGENNSRGYITGLDLKLFGEFVPGVDSWLTFSLMSAKEKTSSGYVPLPTEQRYSIGLFFQDYIPRFPKYRFSLKAIWSDGLPMAAPKKGRADGYFRTPPYRRVDIGLSRRLAGGEDRIMQKPFFRGFKSIWIGLDVFNLLDFSNVNSYYWVTDIYNNQNAVPNYLTGRQFNLRLSFDF